MMYNKPNKGWGEPMTGNKASAFDCALQYLGARMRSEQEIIRYLEKKKYSETEIEGALEKLRMYRYVDDGMFARELVRSKTSLRPMGRRALEQAMYRYGVDKQAVQEGLDTYTPEQEQEACDMLFEKLAQKNGMERTGMAKTQRTLLSRGFSYDNIRMSAQRYKDGDWDET